MGQLVGAGRAGTRAGSPRLVQSSLVDHQLYELHPIVVLGLDLDPKDEDTGVPREPPHGRASDDRRERECSGSNPKMPA